MAQYDTQYTSLPEPVPPRRTLWPLAGVMALDLVIILVLVLVLTTLVVLIFIGMRMAGGGALPSPTVGTDQEQVLRLLGVGGFFAILLVQNVLFIGVPVLRVAVLRREPLAELGFRARPLSRLILIGIGLGVLVLICNGALGALFSSLGIQQNQAEQYPLFQGDYVGQALFFFGAALLVPIGEETLFRGYVFNALRLTFEQRPWGRALAYLVSALLFSAAHSLSATQGLIGLLIPTFCMGLLLAWGMHRTGSLIPCIIAHAMNNGIGLLALVVCVNNPGMCPNI
jgi:membrane protease YdiL (CAAX protease family)